MLVDGFLLQILLGAVMTIKLACVSALLGMVIGLLGALLESIPYRLLRYLAASFIFLAVPREGSCRSTGGSLPFANNGPRGRRSARTAPERVAFWLPESM